MEDDKKVTPLKCGCYLTRNGRVAVITEVNEVVSVGHVWAEQHMSRKAEWITLTGKCARKAREAWDIVRRADLPIDKPAKEE
jgi:hypothetical protein